MSVLLQHANQCNYLTDDSMSGYKKVEEQQQIDLNRVCTSVTTVSIINKPIYPRVCRYWRTSLHGGCRHGQECHYIHIGFKKSQPKTQQMQSNDNKASDQMIISSSDIRKQMDIKLNIMKKEMKESLDNIMQRMDIMDRKFGLGNGKATKIQKNMRENAQFIPPPPPNNAAPQPTKPTKAEPTKPTKAEPTKPSKTEPTKPTKAKPTKPTKAEPTKPTKAEPTKTTKAKPTKTTKAEPTKATKAEPTKATKEPKKAQKKAIKKKTKKKKKQNLFYGLYDNDKEVKTLSPVQKFEQDSGQKLDGSDDIFPHFMVWLCDELDIDKYNEKFDNFYQVTYIFYKLNSEELKTGYYLVSTIYDRLDDLGIKYKKAILISKEQSEKP